MADAKSSSDASSCPLAEVRVATAILVAIALSEPWLVLVADLAGPANS
jgi:hypothetical protein